MLHSTGALASVALTLSLLTSTSAMATSQRTFVASTGNDANPCSLTQPCRSFAVAIAQTASSGEVIVLDSAGYGAVDIAKSISIVAPDGVYAGISVPTGGTGINIAAPMITVALRGLTLRGAGLYTNGIVMSDGAALQVERCDISGVSGAGFTVTAQSPKVFVLDSVLHENALGMSIGGSGVVTLDHTRIVNNTSRLAARSQPSITIRDSMISGNYLGGAELFGTNGKLTLVDSIVSDNGSGGVVVQTDAPLSQVVLELQHCTIVRNTIGVSVLGGGGSGIVLGNATGSVADSTIAGNTLGIYVDGANQDGAASMTMAGNRITDNIKGILAQFKGELRTLQNNVVDKNGMDIDVSSGGIVTQISGI